MPYISLIAALLGLVQGFVGLVGTLLIFISIDYPQIFRTQDGYREQQLETRNPNGTVISTKRLYYSNLNILSGYSTDSDREVIFCFSIICSFLNLIWIVSSVVMLVGYLEMRYRRLWQWVLTTLAILVFDFIGGIYFAVKAGSYINNFHTSEELDMGSFMFRKYGYPLVLLFIFGRGLITIPINVILGIIVYKKAEMLFLEDNKMKLPITSAPVVITNGVTDDKNSLAKPHCSNGLPSRTTGYTNETFTIDEKL